MPSSTRVTGALSGTYYRQYQGTSENSYLIVSSLKNFVFITCNIIATSAILLQSLYSDVQIQCESMLSCLYYFYTHKTMYTDTQNEGVVIEIIIITSFYIALFTPKGFSK